MGLDGDHPFEEVMMRFRAETPAGLVPIKTVSTPAPWVWRILPVAASLLICAGVIVVILSSSAVQDRTSPAPAQDPPAPIEEPEEPAPEPQRLTFNFRNADFHDVIDLIARDAEPGILTAPDVKGTITLSINNVPQDQVLDAVVKTLGFTSITDTSGLVLILSPDAVKREREFLKAMNSESLKLPPEASLPAVEKSPHGVTLALKNADVKESIEQIAKTAGANIVIHPEVTGTVAGRINGARWLDALNGVARVLGYRTVREPSGIIRVLPPQRLAQELRLAKRLGEKRWTPSGKRDVPRVSFTFRDADVADVIDMLARVGKANIAVTPEVRGAVSLSINNTSWEDGLDAVVKTLGYVVVRDESGALRVVHADALPEPEESRDR